MEHVPAAEAEHKTDHAPQKLKAKIEHEMEPAPYSLEE